LGVRRDFLSTKDASLWRRTDFLGLRRTPGMRDLPRRLSRLNYRTSNRTSDRDIPRKCNIPSRDDAWTNIIKGYTKRELMKDKDKLITIKNIINKINNSLTLI